MKRGLLLIPFALVACENAESPMTAVEAGPSVAAPVFAAMGGGGIADEYIVVLNKEGNPRSVAAIAGVAPKYVYTHALNGFAATLNQGQLNALRNNAAVDYVEQNQVAQAAGTQSNATWGLDRADQRDLPLNSTYTYNADGTGVHAYIIDTGIRLDHSQFTGRMSNGYDAITSGGNANDCNGHGSHVAGTVAGTTYGIAKKATLHPVRVLDCNGSGSNAGVIAGMDWVAQNRVRPAVANMSLGGGASQATDDAVQRMVNAGVTVVVAAGNSNTNACNSSPARAVNAITVGSTTNTDARSSFSNYGSCLDIFAPGSNITSAWYTGSTATNTISGTSMASPHVAGVAALYLQSNTGASAATVTSAILNAATTGKVTSAGSGSPNRLLYSLLSADGGGGTTAPCTGCTNYTGSLSSSGDSDVQPNGDYYYSGKTGYHKGYLRGPSSGADFDLYLYKWNGSSWSLVKKAESSTSSEDISYYGSAGYYYWKVLSYSGSGSYDFWLSKP